MGHLRKKASLDPRVTKQVGMVPSRVDSIDNLADFSVTVLSRDHLIHPLQQIPGLNIGRTRDSFFPRRGETRRMT